MTAVPPPASGQQDADHPGGWIHPASEQGALPRLLSALASRWWVMGLAVAFALVAAVAYLATAPKVYEAENDVLVTPVPNSTAVPGFGLILDSSDPARATETIARLVMTPAVADRAGAKLGLRTNARALLGDVEGKPVAQSNLVAITAKAHQPIAAARLADAFGQALIDERTSRLHRALNGAIRVNDDRLAQLGPGDAAQRQLLLARGTDLRTLRDAPDPSLQLASNADVPGGAASPRPLLTIAGALFAGGILGVLAVLALEYVDPRLWREEQLGVSYRLPILARVPRERADRSHPLAPEAISPRAAHAYRMLRANLPSTPRPVVSRRPHTRSVGLLDSSLPTSNGAASDHAPEVGARGRYVMVTSALDGDGKTTTALNLVAALAAGGERVILVDADTEQPGVTEVLGLRRDDGLAGVIWEHTPLVDALVPVRMGIGTVYVLRAEAGAQDGLSDVAAAAVLAEASAFAEWVVVDLPPLHASPDALPLARAATDLLVAVRLRHTNLRELARLGELLTQQRLVPAGFVVTGTRGRTGTGQAVPVAGESSQSLLQSRTADGSAAGRAVPQAPVVPG